MTEDYRTTFAEILGKSLTDTDIRIIDECLNSFDMDTVLETAKTCHNAASLKKKLNKKTKNTETAEQVCPVDVGGNIAAANVEEELFDIGPDAEISETAVEVERPEDVNQNIDEAYKGYFDTIRTAQKLTIDDLNKFFSDQDTKLTIFNLPTSFGKTYMIPAIAYHANKNGSRFIYACSTRSSIGEVYQMFMSGGLKAYYEKEHPIYGYRKILLIPSKEDGIVSFFVKAGVAKIDKTNTLENIDKLPNVTKKDYEALQNFLHETDEELLKRHELHESACEALVQLLDKIKELDKVKSALKTDKSRINKNTQEELRSEFTANERIILKRIQNAWKEYFKKAEKNGKTPVDAKKEILRDMPWIGKLYPGFCYELAEVVIVTNKKLDTKIDPVANRLGTFCNPEQDDDHNAVILMDECDQFCDDLLSNTTENATKITTDLTELLCTAFAKAFPRILKIDEKNPDKSELMIIKTMCYKDNEANERLRKEAVDLWKKLTDFNGRFLNCINKPLIYNTIKDSDGKHMDPIITVNKNRAEIVGEKKDGDDIVTLIMRESEENDNHIDILYHKETKKEEKQENKNEENGDTDVEVKVETADNIDVKFTEYCYEGAVIARRFIELLRKMSGSYDSSHPGQTMDKSRHDVCIHFGFDEEQSRYIISNMLLYRNRTVGWGHQYAYGVTWNRLRTDNPAKTKINLISCNAFPDFKAANIVLNHKKTIWCSATANMRSKGMPDKTYVVREVRRNQLIEELKSKKSPLDDTPIDENEIDVSDCNKLMYTMESIPIAAKMLKEERREGRYKNIHLTSAVFNIKEIRDDFTRNKEMEMYFHTLDKNGKERFICKSYLEKVTGVTCKTLFRGKNIDNENDKKGLRRLAFAAFSMDQMIKANVHAGIIYQMALPCESDEKIYSVSMCERLSKFILKKNGLDSNFKIERVNTSNKNRTRTRNPDEYVLLLSSYASTAAGSNLEISVENKDGTKSGPFNFSAVFVDTVTNIIPNARPESSDEECIMYGLEAFYVTMKEYEFMREQTVNDEEIKKNGRIIFGKLNNEILPSILGTKDPFTKDFLIDNPMTLYKETVRKNILQAINRVERGNPGEENMLIAMSDELIDSGKIEADNYKGTYLGYMFERYLNSHEFQYALDYKDLDKLDENVYSNYQERNCGNHKIITNHLERIQKMKEAGLDTSKEAVKYNNIRDVVATCGYGDDPRIGEYYYINDSIPDLARNYMATCKENENELDRAQHTRIVSRKKNYMPMDIAIRADRPGHFGELRYMEDHKWLGENWQKEYPKEVIAHREEIEKYGFKHIPFTSTYDIVRGYLYESLFKAVSCKSGALDIGYNILPYYDNILEDFDLYYEGTSVLVDVKGYHNDRNPSTVKKLKEKAARYKNVFNVEPTIVIVNAASMDNMSHDIKAPVTDIEGIRKLVTINGLADMTISDADNDAYFTGLRRLLLSLCNEAKM